MEDVTGWVSATPIRVGWHRLRKHMAFPRFPII
jgi:hypothetical protein